MLAFRGNGYGGLTATAGTKIRFLIQPSGLTQPGRTRITKIVYTAAGTAHTVTVMRHIGKTTTTAAAAAAATVVNLAADPGAAISNALAAGDLLAIRETDGVTRLYVVSSVTGLAVTLAAGLAVGVAVGVKVWDFGVEADTDPSNGLAHPGFRGIASQSTTYEDREAGVCATHETDAPILVSSNNATAAGTLDQLSWALTIN